jgi:NitT/TauT family transport system substrate-binding protein
MASRTTHRLLAALTATIVVASACTAAASPTPTTGGGGAQPSTGGAQPSTGGGEPSTGGSQPSGGGSQPSTAASAPTGPATNIKFTFDWKPDGDWAPLLIAEQKGYLKDENITVQYVEGNGSSDALPLIGSGVEDIGQISAPPLIQSVPQDVPVTSVGVMMTASPNVIICNEKVKTPKDLEKGLIFGDQVGEFEHAIWLAWAKANNIDISKVNVIPATGASDVEFIEGRLDCRIEFYTSGAMIGLTEGHEGDENLFLIRDSLTLYGHTMVANNDFLAANPEAVKGFNRAWAKGMKDVVNDPDAAVALLLEKFPDKNNPEGKKATEWSVEKYAESWKQSAGTTGFLTFTDEGWKATKDAIVEGGLTNGEDIDISKLYTDDYLPEPPILP